MADDHQQDADEVARNRAALEDYDRAQNMRDRHAQFVERQQNLSGMAEQVSTQGSGQEQVSPQGRDQPGSPLPPLRLGRCFASTGYAAVRDGHRGSACRGIASDASRRRHHRPTLGQQLASPRW